MTRDALRTVRATAPLRADLAGGTLDLWPLGLLEDGGATVAVAVDLRVEAVAGPSRRTGRLELRAEDLRKGRSVDPGALSAGRPGPLELLERTSRAAAPGVPLRLATRSPVRAGSGLGTSSALGVAAAAACRAAAGLPVRRPSLVPLVRDLEARVLGIPTGTQDHEAALRGGLVVLAHRPGGARVTRLAGGGLAALRECLLLVDSGKGRSSGVSNWDLFRRRIEGDPAAVRAFRRVARAGARAAEAAAGLPVRRPSLVPLVRDLEARVLGIPTGTQDHEAALRGGIVVLSHRPGGARVARLAGAALAALRECLLLVDSGKGRSSGVSNWDLFRRRIEGDAAAVRAFRKVARAGSRAAEALVAGDLRALGRAMREDMAARADWSPLVLTPALEAILGAARRAGALGEKVCGAGGGGYAVILAPPDRRERIAAAVREAGGDPSPARPTGRGLRLEAGDRPQRT